MNGYEFFSPITYYTDVNSVLTDYYSRFKYNWIPYPVYNFGSGKSNSGSLFTGWYGWGAGRKNDGWISNPMVTYPVYNFTGKKSLLAKKEKVSKVKTKSKVESNSKVKPDKNVQLRRSFVKNAEKYLGYNEKDESYKKFSDSPEWCADFVTYVIKESYKAKGRQIPDDFGNHRVENIKQWAIANNVMLQTAGKSNKAQIIKNKVKPGDILILRENGASHTGIVSKVNDDGSFETIEGNVKVNGNDCVVRQTYSPNHKDITGFVQLV